MNNEPELSENPDDWFIEAELIERGGITFGVSFPVEPYNPPS